MCGLNAYYTTKTKNIKLAQSKFRHLLFYSQDRGVDATGICLIKKIGSCHQLRIAKKDVPATEFMKTGIFKETIKVNSLIGIGHNRQKTQGFATNNANNHPLFVKSGLALVHNGTISNDIDLGIKYHLKTDGVCDSEVLLALIERYYKQSKASNMIKAIQKATSKVDGTIAFLLLNNKEPKTLYAVSVDNPIVFAYHKLTGIIYIASTESILEKSLFIPKIHFGYFGEITNQDEYLFYTLEDETGVKITPYGITEFKVEKKADVIYTGRQFPAVEEQDENGYLHSLNNEEFDPTSPITKPSGELSNDLMSRLRVISYSMSYPEHLEKGEYSKLLTERDRILVTLVDRTYMTKSKAEQWKIDTILGKKKGKKKSKVIVEVGD